MACRYLPTAERLRQLLDYNPETGIFTWKPRNPAHHGWNTRYAGQVAGNVDERGYIRIVIDYKLCFAHRLAWVYIHGVAPTKPYEIDHIDAKKWNNKISNLRIATRSLNLENSWRHGRTNGR